jgi:hypothetical protein
MTTHTSSPRPIRLARRPLVHREMYQWMHIVPAPLLDVALRQCPFRQMGATSPLGKRCFVSGASRKV